jgi:hypothetical protein
MELEPPQALENRALQQFPTDQRGGGESQQILRSWFARLRKQVDPDTAQYGRQICDAVRVLEGIREGVTGLFWLDEIVGNRKERAARFDLWAWPTDAEVEQWAYRGTGRAGLDDLETALADYLKRPWLQHDAIDISAINALIIAEIAERFLDVKTGAALGKVNRSFIFSGGNVFAETGLAFAGMIFGFLAAWVLVPALAIGLLVQGHEMGAIITIGIWAFYVVYRLIMIPVRWRARKFKEKIATTVADRLTAMVKAWHRLPRESWLHARRFAICRLGATNPCVRGLRSHTGLP